ncbi:uracil/xanthine transporter [Bacillus tianshenii]|uniref:uracil/xanthine transporter n=1 Tax=Sutcliffiella tianshenii TaxID=1463404 RepID=UPI001CD60F84|nr:uracil/xanthine transporter [Bacillus tianshenii]MCA1318290.1 uracil/xanthine transporter [Bacillus tianshenii]
MKNLLSSFTVFSSIQWLFFIFANTVVVPLSIGAAFDVSPEVSRMILSASLLFTGLACIFQGLLGHRYPLLEGHSGLLWGVMLNLGLTASSLGMSFTEIGGGLATGLLLAGAVTMLMALFGWTTILPKIFTPMVMTVYLFLLTFQLMMVFFQGMLGITDDGTMNVGVSLLSLFLVIFVSVLKIKAPKAIGNFAILIGIVVGWILYVVLFPESGQEAPAAAFSFKLFPLGAPNLEYGIIAVAFFAGVLNLSNTIASVQAAAELYREKAKPGQFRNSFFFTGLFSMVASLFGLVPYTPFTSTIGFLQSTRILDKRPFFIGGMLLAVIGLLPPLTSFLVTMPMTVGNAVLFVAYLQLFGTAYGSLRGAAFNSDTIFRLAAPVLLGVCLMNTSPAVFGPLPVLLQPFLTNGLIMGVLLSIVLEKVTNWGQFEDKEVRRA